VDANETMNASTINPTNNPFFITASFLSEVSGLQLTSNHSRNNFLSVKDLHER
jgi:hypothetical protein